MSELISYRYNVTRLDSLEAFLEIRGSRGNGQPEVYFVRALGETADYGDRLLMLERKMNEKTAGGELFYLRLDGLPQMLRTEDGSSYSAIWEVCAAEKRLQGMKRIPENPELSRAIVNALFAAQEKFCAEKTGATQTIIRNFMAKILFWLDCAAFECFENWNAQKVIKVVGVNVTGLQEYLFFYFLTQLGCDVLLAEMEADVKGSEKLT